VTDVRSRGGLASAYRRSAKSAVSFMKGSTNLRELWARAVDLPDGFGHLLPVGEIHADDGAVIDLMTRWREENAFAFPTRFPVSAERTARWLRERLLDVEDRLLFLVVTKHGRIVGHLGIAGASNREERVEIDNVLRGEKDAEPGTMSAAMWALLDWIEEYLAPQETFLRVLASNEHAIAFYKRLRFDESGLIPLRRVVDGDTETLEEAPEQAGSDDAFVVMTFRPERRFEGESLVLTAGPSISEREVVYGQDAIRHGWNNQWSNYLRRFEAGFADYVGTTYAVATSSCTGALHLALAALGIGRGDEVIVPELTWVATANAVRYVGATPVFADVDPLTWCVDPASVEALVTTRTRAVIPVHLYGYPADMAAVMELAAARGLSVIEDAAPAIGAEWDGRKLGSFGDAAAFSFQGAKLVVTGEGGMLVSSAPEFFERVRIIADQGRDPHRTFWIMEQGLKYKMSNLQAALGLGQLERVDQLIAAKRRIHDWYRQGLGDVPGLAFQQEPARGRSIHWMTSIVLPGDLSLSRDDVIAELRARNVDTRPVFPAISQYPIWDGDIVPQPVASTIGARAINLPSGVRLGREVVDYVCRSVRAVLGR
jgi:perosamine synthetase